MWCWIDSHFYDWIDYNGVTFSMSYQNGVAHFRDYGVKESFASSALGKFQSATQILRLLCQGLGH